MKEETLNMKATKKPGEQLHPSEGYLIYCSTEEELGDCLEDKINEESEDGFIEDFDDDGFIEDIAAAQSSKKDVNSTLVTTNPGMVDAHVSSPERALDLEERHVGQFEVDIVIKREPSPSRAELEEAELEAQFDASQRERLMMEYCSSQIPHYEVGLGGQSVTERSTMDSASSAANHREVDTTEENERHKECEINRPIIGKRRFREDCSIIEQSSLTSTKSHVSKTIINPLTGEKSYRCSVCNRLFTQSCSLTIHMRRHTGDKPYECSFCSRRFYSGSNLEVHTRTHTGERPFPCSVCKKAFSQWSNLSQHMTTHTGEKLYQCKICHKSFSQSGVLNRHMRTHSGETPCFQCSVCDKQFSFEYNLSRHMRLHTGEKPYQCSICNKAFTHKSSFSVHTKNHAKAIARTQQSK